MTELLGMPGVAEVAPGHERELAEVARQLSVRQQRMLAGACNFHALDAPGSVLRIVVYEGQPEDYPRLTDVYRRGGSSLEGRRRIGEFTIRSVAVGRGHDFIAPDIAPATTEPDTFRRHILVSADTALHGTKRSGGSLYWRAREEAENRFPVQYDYIRQRLLARRMEEVMNHVIPRRQWTKAELAIAPLAPSSGPQAVLIGMHWLELGGAERWAVQTVAAVRDAGYVPIVITDKTSHHPWLSRPELDGALTVNLTYPIDAPEGEEPVLQALFENYDIRGVIVHHCHWLYDRLPLIKRWRPEVPTVDSQHIVEYGGGGYPASGVHLDEFIDVHHTISPQLVEWLTGPQQVSAEKIVMAPLVGLTASRAEGAVFSPRRDPSRLRLGFIGRFTRQKRPYLFLRLLRRLARSGAAVDAIVQGGGELEATVRREVVAWRLRDFVEIRAHDFPVEQTLAEIDLLVVSSQNEGITLTTLEALAAGVPVLSADVGAQSTIVVPDALVSQQPQHFLEQAQQVILRMLASEAERERIWRGELARAEEFSAHTSAQTWIEQELTAWRR